MAELAEQINEEIDQALATFKANMQTRGNAAWRKVAKQIRSMDVDDRGMLVPSAGNTQALNAVSVRLMETIDSPKMTQSINRMKNKLEPIRTMTEKFYADKFPNIPAPQQIITTSKALVTATKTLIDNEIGQAAFTTDVINPIANTLSQAITGGRGREATVNDIKGRIQNRIRTFTDIKAATRLQQYGRRLNDLFGRLNSRKAKYTGPRDEKNRDFCSAKVGKEFTVEQIMNWTTQDWDGKIPNTDRGSIFVNLGGYNCRHVLEWE